jgi:PhnB protein
VILFYSEVIKGDLMQTNVEPIPRGYHTLTPYLIVKDAARAIEFYKHAFHAQELFRMDGQGGRISHCELQIGDSKIMMADEMPEMKAVAPSQGEGNSFSLLIYVKDVDLMFKQAIEAGAKVLRPLKDEFYGDRMGALKDPFGHVWNLGMHIEDVTPEEMKKRLEEMKH